MERPGGVKVDALLAAARSAEKKRDFSAAQRAYVTVLERFPANARARKALRDLDAALAQFHVEGIATTISLHREIINHPDFRANRIHTRWLEQVLLPARQAEKAA